MRNLKLTLAYDGTDFCGWQVQPAQRTVQETLEKAIAGILGEEIRVTGSGRTDSGVHADGQVASFATENQLPAADLKRALNAELPEDVSVLEVEDVAPDFSALHSAARKRYRYRIDNGRPHDVFKRRFQWHVPKKLDDAAMQRAAEALLGKHDFSSFESIGSPRADSIRTIFELSVKRGQGSAADFVTTEIEGDGFLYNMVRAITGTLVEVGRGYKSESWPAEVLAARDRSVAGPTAPAQGLSLIWVGYE